MQQEASSSSQHDPRQESPLGELLSQLFKDSEILLLQELALVRAELGDNLGRLAAAALFLLAGVLTVFSGGLALIAALIVLLSDVMSLWVACVLVGAILFIVGAILALYARRIVARARLFPHRALQSLRDTGAWAREELT